MSINGSDSNPGTSSEPLTSVSVAIKKVEELFGTGMIKVSEGTYYIEDGIYMKNGISLYGGYSQTDWDTRNPSIYLTVLKHRKKK